MSKIHRLDPHLTNMIAAGEVVERPSGVIKELVENSIDAKATKIDVHIVEGGLQEMCVIDNGCGMSKEDALLAFERHATSKLHDMQDLWKITTMGFRGEALPSIASVASVELQSNDSVESSVVEIAYGTIIKHKSMAVPQGTQITIYNLFQKTPARFKHLKSPNYEFSLISDVMQKFALAYPNIAFSLTNDEKRVFTTNGNGNLQEIMMNIYGREALQDAIKLDGQDNDYKIEGYALQPKFNRANKYYMQLYINHRMIRSFRLQKAILEAYSSYIPSSRYPIVVVNVSMDPQLVDVNVHPSKWEIRLSKEKQLEQLLFETIRKELHQDIKTSSVSTTQKEVVEPMSFAFQYPKEVQSPLHQEVSDSFVPYATKEESKIESVEPLVVETPPAKTKESTSEAIVDCLEQETMETVDQPKPKVSALPSMRVLAQLHDSYIICEGDDGMYLIDQHAAQERFHFEQLQNKLLSKELQFQELLVPISLNVDGKAMALLDDINELVESIGIEFERFGSTTCIVRRLPFWMSQVKEEEVLLDILDYFLKHQEVNMEQLRKHTIATMACHSSIRFSRKLSMLEMQQVVLDLQACEQPFHCPHGRPTFIELTLKQLEKDFLRVM